MVTRLAMWSPPRARSTLMMRVFGALGCSVFDEPFYAYWLKTLNKRDDPGYDLTVAAHETDWRRIVQDVLDAPVGTNGWSYQKHMAIHMLPEVDLGWMSDPAFVHCFLIRDPREVIASMTEFRDLRAVLAADGAQAAAELVGIPQLQRIYDQVCKLGQVPPVLDANRVLRDPVNVLSAFCSKVGLPFDPDQDISWPAGQHANDGAWAPLWYQKVFATTSLKPYKSGVVQVSPDLKQVVDACMPTYEKLYEQSV